MATSRILDSFFLAGFECSTHRRADGRRLDLLESTAHARLAAADYGALAGMGIAGARDGLRWHLIESRPGQYDWSSFLPMLRAASDAGIHVIWDLCHYGWPDGLDIWSPAFVERFAAYCEAAAHVITTENGEGGIFCPMNEISYWAWAGGEMGLINPCDRRRGAELKRQLVRAAIAGIRGVRNADRRARIMQPEPLIHVAPRSADSRRVRDAELYRLAQYEAWDMLAGRQAPELGGDPSMIDIIGVNYYPHNQWYLNGSTIPMGHHAYRPLIDMLREVYDRYGKPVLISETGAEGGARPYWLHYVAGEVAAAMEEDIPIGGICLYPVLDYHGWDNDRVCRAGLLSLADEAGRRQVDAGLRAELRAQQAKFDSWRELPRTRAGDL